ncbi:MAG: CDP-glucose 4,6-dehydratase [Parvularculaceae bacterium]
MTLGMKAEFWKGRRVLVTGHTGFKGAWLALWLDNLGARVSGFALAPETEPNLWRLLDLDARVHSRIADICDRAAVARALDEDKPEIVFHLAAQSLVRRSYREPEETFAANVGGVVTLLHAISQAPSVKATVIATSDKCYENLEEDRPFTEEDRFGGRDPYSASKGCAEIAAAAMRQSFFAPYRKDGASARIATARAGNVIGGGDWSEDRLAPDIVRGCLGPKAQTIIRSPRSVRPWQHVLEPLRGYVMLAERLADGADVDGGWNFGPDEKDARTVLEAATKLAASLGRGKIVVEENPDAPHEAKLLRLDAGKAIKSLGWRPALGFDEGIEMTAAWYRAHHAGANARDLTLRQIEDYMRKAS